MNIFSRGLRNTFRSGVRAFSLIIILSVIIGLALTMLIARQAVNEKITSVKSSIGNTITVSPAGVRGFEGGGTPLTSAEVAKITSTAHVASTTSTLSARLSSTDTSLTSSIDAGTFGQRQGESSSSSSSSSTSTSAGTTTMAAPTGTTGGGGFGGFASIDATGTTDATTLSEIGSVTLASGSQIDASGSGLEALIGSGLATKNNLKVGSTFTVYGKTVTVKGIINATNNRFAGNVVVLPLATLQTLASESGDVSSVTVTVDSIDNVDATVKSLQSTLGLTADVVNDATSANSAIAPLESIGNLSLFVLIVSVAVGAIVILLIMIMIVRERRREVGVMKAIGASTGTISLQFMVEAATLTLIAAVIGIIASILAAGPITNLLVTNASSTSTTSSGGMPGGGGGGFRRAFGSAATNITNVTTHIDWTIVLYGLGAALLIALIGSLIASLFVAHIKPAEAVRAE